jgi:tetratricopeptide (TPR) repeat protein
MPKRLLALLTAALALPPAACTAEDDERTQELVQRLFDRQAPLLAKGNFDGAEKLQKEAEAAIATLRDKDARELGTAIARVGRGAIAERRGHYGEAAAAFRDARDYFRKRGATPAEVAMAVNLGGMLTKQGDFKGAAAVLEEGRKALAGLGEIGRAPVEAKLLGNLGAAYVELGETSKALPCLEASAELARKAGQPDAERNARANLAFFPDSPGELPGGNPDPHQVAGCLRACRPTAAGGRGIERDGPGNGGTGANGRCPTGVRGGPRDRRRREGAGR